MKVSDGWAVRIAIAVACSVLLVGPASTLAKGHHKKLRSLGTPPVPCLPVGSTANACGDNLSTGVPPNFMPSTFYGQLDMSPHIVRIGQTATEIIIPSTTAGTPDHPITTRWYPPGTPLPGSCLDDPGTGNSTTYSCQFKVNVAGDYPAGSLGGWRGGWNVVELGICGFLGCSPSGTYFHVQATGRAISGTVLDASGGPVAGVTVNVSGPTSGAVRSDSTGFYSAINLKPGRYSVSVAGGSGQATRCSPGSASGTKCTLDLSQADGDADFAVCPTAAGARGAFAPRAGPGADCPLIVAVKPVDTKTNSGLDLNGGAFTEASGCASGCIDLLVTVTDPATSKPVSNADVTVQLSRTTGKLPPYPSGAGSGTGHLCTFVDRGGGCSDNVLTGLTALKTDANGQVAVIYWAPGLIPGAAGQAVGHALVVATAMTPTNCSCKQKSGSSSPERLTVSPHRIFIGDAPLSNTEMQGVIEYVAPIDVVKLAQDIGKDKLWDKIKDAALKRLIGEEVTKAVLNPYLGAALFVKDLVDEAKKQERELMAVAFTAVGLVDTGLGYGPTDQPRNYASDSFVDAFVGRGSVSGMLSRLGDRLNQIQPGGNAVGDLRIHLKIFEVSYCEPGISCAPGPAGIHPYLDFQFSADRRTPSTQRYAQVLKEDMVQPYNPHFWAKAQLGLGF